MVSDSPRTLIKAKHHRHIPSQVKYASLPSHLPLTTSQQAMIGPSASARASKASSNRTKPNLTPDEALTIFALRPKRSEHDRTFLPSAGFCRELALKFKCCDRTIRDIWNRRSWGHTTRPLWTLPEIAADPSTCDTLDDSIKARVVPVKDRRQGRPSRRQSSDAPSDTHSDPSQQAAEPTSDLSLSVADDSSMGDCCSSEASVWSSWLDSASLLDDFDSSSFCEGLFDEDALNHAAQNEQQQTASADEQAEAASQQQADQQPWAGEQMEAAIFAELAGSAFSDPFAEAWSQRQRYIAMQD